MAASMGIVVRPDALTREVARRGWTLADLAQASGLSGPTITAAIAGRSISPVSLRLIVRALLATPVLERVDDLLADGRRPMLAPSVASSQGFEHRLVGVVLVEVLVVVLDDL